MAKCCTRLIMSFYGSSSPLPKEGFVISANIRVVKRFDVDITVGTFIRIRLRRKGQEQERSSALLT